MRAWVTMPFGTTAPGTTGSPRPRHHKAPRPRRDHSRTCFVSLHHLWTGSPANGRIKAAIGAATVPATAVPTARATTAPPMPTAAHRAVYGAAQAAALAAKARRARCVPAVQRVHGVKAAAATAAALIVALIRAGPRIQAGPVPNARLPTMLSWTSANVVGPLPAEDSMSGPSQSCQ